GVDSREQLVAGLYRADARGRAGEDHVARLERVVIGEIGDLLRNRPDHVRKVGLLALLAVHVEPDRALGRMTELGGRHELAAGRRLVEVLAEVPRASVVLAPLLEVAAGHVETYGVSVDVVVGALGVDATSALRQRDDELGLVVVVRGLRRVVNRAAPRNQG